MCTRTKKSHHEGLIDAQVRGSQWLADGNEAHESGSIEKAECCYDKAQFWLDRANLLSGYSDRPAPKIG